LIEFDQLVLEKKIFKKFQCIFTLLLLEMDNPLHLKKKFESPPPKNDLCAKFGYNWPFGSGEEVENVNIYRRTTDNKRSE
jgi:hypothetical protein